jgi:predicted transcriptional regulator
LQYQGTAGIYVCVVDNRKIEKAFRLILKEKCEETAMKLNKTDEKVVNVLIAENKELTLQELADKTGETSKKVFRSLRKLFESEIVSTQGRKYKITINDVKAIKAKLAAKADEEENKT